jgi:hypothetical protein
LTRRVNKGKLIFRKKTIFISGVIMDWTAVGSIALNLLMLIPIAGVSWIAVNTYKSMVTEAN